MAGGGGPNPKGKQVEHAVLIDKDLEDSTITFQIDTEDIGYFETGQSYKLIAIEK